MVRFGRYLTDRRKIIKNLDSTGKPHELNLLQWTEFCSVRTKYSRWQADLMRTDRFATNELVLVLLLSCDTSDYICIGICMKQQLH